MSLAPEQLRALQRAVESRRDAIIRFLREICAIPSMDSQIRAVGERVAEEMQRLGFDEVRWDVQGNILGRIGNGTRVIVFDSHLDTVGIGDRSQWAWDPFEGKVENGILFARGACDEKNSTPGMVYGIALARDLGLLEGWTAYYFGNIEEWCDGIAPRVFVEHDPKLRPDFVVIGEPTRMQVYRGHKGRVEMQITIKGRSAHAASNWLGDNAIYKALPIIAGVRDLDAALCVDPFLGKGTITVSDMKVSTVSINAVPDQVTLFLDRRLTPADTIASALAEVQAVIAQSGVSAADISLSVLKYAEPSWNGFVLEVDKYYPAWVLDESHSLVQAALDTTELVFGQRATTGKWDFSTNGTYWAGIAGIPSIGFGPGDERHAHSVLDQVPLEDVVRSTLFYAALPAVLRARL
ncbi:MAG: YgeY family selenium metabolism-linked hydrolase [Thermoflexales bacterium]|nr:YgeY family selenium metabolism-linked hydrolase [Thermoflexales bacterium]MCS7324487.1 YgeY family selenium metabolism-linked hydrolase [Thermoflexales bacterium]